MSTQPRAVREVTCDRSGCDETGPEYEFRDGDYCSTECYHRQKGADHLNNFIYDHRWCGACFRRLKEVERPTDDHLRTVGPISADAVDGYQYPTPNATLGECELHGLDDEASHAPSDSLVGTGVVCAECGTTTHYDEYMRDLETPSGVARRILRATEVWRREGQHDKTLDASVFVQTLKETNCDWALATGRALTDD